MTASTVLSANAHMGWGEGIIGATVSMTTVTSRWRRCVILGSTHPAGGTCVTVDTILATNGKVSGWEGIIALAIGVTTIT